MTAIERRTAAVGDRKFSYRLSLWAYVPPFLWLATLVVLSPWIAAFTVAGAIAILAVASLWVLYQVWWLHSVELFADDEGVWIFRGVMPWSRGVYGVKWWNLDEATFVTGFVSWLTKSYRVQVTHRYTKRTEIALSHVARGDQAVKDINALLQVLRQRGDEDRGAWPTAADAGNSIERV